MTKIAITKFNLISWSSRKQPTILVHPWKLNINLLQTLAEILWIQSLIRELGICPSSPPKLWCDNIGAMYRSVNPIFHAQTKHVEIDFHFVCDRVANKSLQVLFVPSSDQLVDVLTKPIVSKRFHDLCFKLNARSPTLTLREGINASSISYKEPHIQMDSKPIYDHELDRDKNVEMIYPISYT